MPQNDSVNIVTVEKLVSLTAFNGTDLAAVHSEFSLKMHVNIRAYGARSNVLQS